MPSDYRLSPAVTARVVGLVVVSIALLMLLATLLVAWLDLHSLVLVVPLVLGLAVLVGAAVLHHRRGWVVRLSEEGYRVQWVRGAGVAAARWKDVEDAVTTEVAGSPVLVMRLRDGRTTTIPVEMVAADRDAFARDVVEHLQRGQGLRPL